jgi:hypothetical protein
MKTERGRVWYARKYDAAQAGSIDGSCTNQESEEHFHDHGVVRAVAAQQCGLYNSTCILDSGNHNNDSNDIKECRDGGESSSLKTVFATRLHPLTTEGKLKQFFSSYGDLVSVTLIRNIGISSCVSLVSFLNWKW